MLKEDIENSLKESLKKKDAFQVQVLKFLKSILYNQEIKKKAEGKKFNDQEIISIISSEIKKCKEAISEFEKGNREDLAEKEKKEIEILKKYLPEQLSEKEIKKTAKEIIEKSGYSGIKDMGPVMAEIMPKFQGKAEGKKVAEIVKELL